VERAEEVLDAFGVLRAAAKYATRQPGLASWFREWAELEEQAISLYTFENRLVPGLLQTEGYARTLFNERVPALTDSQIEAQLTAREDRQRLLAERPKTTFSFIIEEHIIRRGTGGLEVTRGLIDHVLTVTELRNVQVSTAPSGYWRLRRTSGSATAKASGVVSSSLIRNRSACSTCAMRNCVHRLSPRRIPGACWSGR
jgi:hypothetical protein